MTGVAQNVPDGAALGATAPMKIAAVTRREVAAPLALDGPLVAARTVA